MIIRSHRRSYREVHTKSRTYGVSQVSVYFHLDDLGKALVVLESCLIFLFLCDLRGGRSGPGLLQRHGGLRGAGHV